MDFGSFLLNVSAGGIVGGFASFVASKYFLKHNNDKHRPLLEISDKLIETKREDGTSALQIKILNKTDQDIANVVFEVDGVDNLSPAGSIPLFRYRRIGERQVLYVKKYDADDTNAHFAHRTNMFDVDKDIIEEYKKYNTVKVSLKAECPYYGTSFVTSVDYDASEDILNERHTFNTGDSLSCSSH